jgi:hypothetical protein
VKSTKYQLLKSDFDFACKQLREYREEIERLRYENKHFEEILMQISSGDGLDKALKDNDWLTEVQFYQLLAQQVLVYISNIRSEEK